MDKLETMINEVMGTYRKEKADKQQLEQEKEMQKAYEKKKKLSSLINVYLSLDLREMLNIVYENEYKESRYLDTCASFKYLDRVWYIGCNSEGSMSVVARAESNGHKWYPDVNVAGIYPPNILQTTLLFHMGKYRERVRERERNQKDVERKQKEHQEAIEASIREEQEKTEQLRKDMQEKHNFLKSTLDAEKALALQGLWSWPEGECIIVYYWQYCVGGMADEDVGTYFDYRGGWSLASSLDQDGCVHFEEVKGYSHEEEFKPPCDIMLDKWNNYIVKARRVFTCIDDLPDDLVNKVDITLPYVCTDYRDRDILIEVEDLEEEYWYSEVVGKEPLQWIKDYFDRK